MNRILPHLKAMRLVASTFVACAGLSFSDVSAQTVSGFLLERGTDRPIDLGLVSLVTLDGDSVASMLTDSVGHFSLHSEHPGDFFIVASALGYAPTVASSVITLGAGSSMTLEFRIVTQVIEIEGITIETQQALIRRPQLVQNGFVKRAQEGFGSFVTPGDIENATTLSTVELLRSTGRIATRDGPGGDQVVMLGRGRFCVPVVYLDGVRLLMEETSIDQMAPIDVLQGAEVYRSATEAPLGYAGGAGGCGVIVLWTRSR